MDLLVRLRFELPAGSPEQEEFEVNSYEALEQLKTLLREEGRKEGRKEGQRKGHKDGQKEGRLASLRPSPSAS